MGACDINKIADGYSLSSAVRFSWCKINTNSELENNTCMFSSLNSSFHVIEFQSWRLLMILLVECDANK